MRSRIPRAGLLALLSVLALAGVLLHASAAATDEGDGRKPTAWEEYIRRNPQAVDDDTLGPFERNVLHALSPAQALALVDGAAPEEIVLDTGATLADFLLDSVGGGPGLVYVPVDPCRLFATSAQTAPVTGAMAANEIREYVARGAGTAHTDQGGMLTGCGVPTEAVAVLVHFRIVANQVKGAWGFLKAWRADGPEPGAHLVDYEPLVDQLLENRFRFSATAVVELCGVTPLETGAVLCPTEFKVKTAALGGHVRGDVAGYFRLRERLEAPEAGDADTLDGLDSTAFAAASHTHDGGDITSGTVGEPFIDSLIARLDEIVATLKDNDGAGSGLDADLLDGKQASAFRPRPANVILVHPTDGDFATIQGALDAIGVDPRFPAASASNRYLIRVGGGVYNEQVTMDPFVDIEGKGNKATIISAASQPGPEGTLECADDAELRNLTVESTGGGEKAIAIRCFGASPMLTHIKAIATGAAGGTTPENIGVLNDGAAAMPMLTGVDVDANPSPGLGVVNQNGALPTIRDSDIGGADSSIENRDTAGANVVYTGLGDGADVMAPALQSSYNCVRAYVSGSLLPLNAECFPNTPPTAVDDAYATLGNTLLEVDLATASGAPAVIGEDPGPPTVYADVLDNDTDAETPGSLTASAPATSTLGGDVVMNADGSFSYTPPVGITGVTDDFDYTLTDAGGLTATGNVQIAISEMIWFVDNDAAGGGDGRSDGPFNALTPLDGAGGAGDPDGVGHTIFVFDGTGNTTGGIELEDNQVLQGHEIALDFAGFNFANGPTLVSASTAPSITDVAGDVIELASANTVRGLDIAATAGLAIKGTGVAGVTIDEVGTGGTGTGNGVLFDGVTGTIAMTDLDINASTNWGIAIQNSSATFTFDAASSITNPTGVAISVVSGAPNVTYSGTIANNNAATINISSTTGGTVLFDGSSINGDASAGILLSSVGGNVTVDAGSTTINSSSGPGISIQSASTGTFRFDDVTISSPTGAGIDINGGAGDSLTGTVDFNNVDVTSASASPAVSIVGLGAAAGGVDFDTSSAITSTNGGISITSNGGGTIAFNGPVDLDTAGLAAVNATSNTGATINFAGLLDIDTTSGTGFNVTGGGTVNVDSSTQSTTVDTGTGIGVNIGAGIGATGVTFDTVNVNGSSSGILLANTGTGTFSVTSGTIQNTTSRSFSAANVDGVVSIGASLENNGGRTVEIVTGSAGAFTFAGAIDENALGIEISSNASAATFTFQGGVDIDTIAGNTGFNAFSGGTLAICADTNCDGSGTALTNTVDTTAGTGTAMSVDSVSIGGAGVTVQSINVNPGGAATTAIVLDTTGAGDFTVTGDGTTTTFGGNGSGGTIQNIADADAIRLESTGGAVTFQNMNIQDVADAGDNGDPIGTRSERDGIHGQSVNGGLVLKNVTMRRFSDNAILGSSSADGTGFTVWNGLEIRDSLLEDSNRYHLDQGTGGDASDDLADDNNEGLVRILGIKGMVTVDGSTFRRGGELLDFFTDSSGTLDMTVQKSTFEEPVKEFLCAPPGTVNIGKNCIDVEVRGANAPLIKIGDPAEASAALGNTFTNCGTASVRLLHNAAATGAVKAVISQNDFIITDHLTGPPSCGGGTLQFNHPQGGVSLNTGGLGSSTFEGIVSNNTFDQVMHANGFVGQLALIADDAGVAEFIVRGNDFKLPWDGSVEVQAVGNADARIHFDGNTYTDGEVGGASDDVGFQTQSPFNPFLVNVRDGGSLDLTIEDEVLHQHDDSNSAFARSFDASINASGGTLDLAIFGNTECTSPSPALCDSKSPDGYNLEQNGGTFNLFTKGSCPSTAASILSINDNSGGGGVAGVPNPTVDGDDTKPPVVDTTGTIGCTTSAPTLPSITIP